MARSLTVKHEEAPATSSLLTAFLLLAFGWLGLAAIVSAASAPASPDAAIVYGE
jgi:hypothetical protein